MLAYQMIYTACGKDKSGAFSVWSKSNEISRAECDEIVKLMSYRKAKDAPYEPTAEELKTCFPKKYVYCQLSSGRKCIAQTTYLSQVYSDLDKRLGNFIIHAYVFDSLCGAVPFSVVDTNVFKTQLSYAEWHDAPAPDSLPAVEVDLRPSINEAEIKRYLSDAKKSEFVAMLLQSTINVLSGTEGVVTFNADENEQKLVYSILGLLLPQSMHEGATFANQYSPQTEFALSASGMPPIKIRNIFDGGYSSTFNFQDEIAAGSYAFHLQKGLMPRVEVGAYAYDAVRTLRESGLFAALKKIEKINHTAVSLQCTLDAAVCVENLIVGNLSGFNSARLLADTIRTALAKNYVDARSLAKLVYEDVLRTKRYANSDGVADLTRFVYANGETPVKDALVYEALLDAERSLSGRDPKSFCSELRGNFPFGCADLDAALLRGGNVRRFFTDSQSVGVAYAYFASLVSLVANRSGDVNALQAEMGRLFSRGVAQKNFEAVRFYLETARPLGGKAEEWLVGNALSRYIEQPIASRDDLKFVLDVILCIGDKSAQKNLTGRVVKNNVNSVDFLSVYLSVCDSAPDLFSAIEADMQHDPACASFFVKKQAYVFKNAAEVTPQMLDKYFKDHYVKGNDSGIYLIKLKEYVSRLKTAADKVRELTAQFDKFAPLSDGFADVSKIIDYIDEQIYSIDQSELLHLTSRYGDKLAAISARLAQSGKRSCGYDLLALASTFTEKRKKDQLLVAVMQNRVYVGITARQAEVFSRGSLALMVAAYGEVRKEKRTDYVTMLNSLVAPLAMQDAEFDKHLSDALSKEPQGKYEFMADVMAYAFNRQDAFAARLQTFVKSYVESLKSGEYKKLFKKVETFIRKEDYLAVNAYITAFLDDHKGFFAKLFGKKK